MSLTPERKVSAFGVELAVYTWGAAAPGKPTLLLVHGYPDSASIWQPLAEVLAARYYVIAYDVRGAGASTRPNSLRAYELPQLVNDLAAVIDAMSPDQPVHLLGHDWGSIQCWEAVTTERLRGRIASYTSISGPSLDHAGHWIARRLKSGSPKHYAELARQLAHSWYVLMFHVPGLGAAPWKLGLDKLWPRLLQRLEGVTDSTRNPTQAEDGVQGVNLYRANFRKRLLAPQPRRAEIPVQLIFPRRDKFMIAEIWDDLPQWAPRLWRREVDAGHWLQLSHPQQLAGWLHEFVAHVEGGPESAGLQRARRTVGRQGLPHSGQLVLITGAGSGIGRETALRFAELGADLMLIDIDMAGLERTVELAELLGASAQARRVDVGNAGEMEALASWLEKELGAPDIVVNNAGIGMSGAVLDMSSGDWERILKVNLWGVIHGARLFGQQMVAAGKRGHIVNVSSGLAFFPTRLTPAYNTSKAAVQMLSECLRAELAGKGIGVSTVYPGIVDTGIVTRTRFLKGDETAQRRRADRLYQRRNLPPSAVAQAIVDAVAHNRAEVRVGLEVHLARWLSRTSPGLTRRLARLDPTR